jgi:hypothetical protein
MTDFQSAFDTNTGGINTALTTQLSSVQQWANIPGSLVKASSSAAGYLWGFNSVNMIWVCQQPCTGQWTQVDIAKLGSNPTASTEKCYGDPVTTSPTNFFYPTPFSQFQAQALSGASGNNLNPNYVSSTLDGAKALAAKNPGARGIFSFTLTTGVQYFAVWDQDPTLGNRSNPTDNWSDPASRTGTFYPLIKCPTPPPTPATILDITTDETNVYVLYSNPNIFVATKSAANNGDWTTVQVSVPNFTPSNIFSTHTYIWLQSSSNQKVKIPKPLNMSNSMKVTDVSVKITSASANALYGVNPSGNAMKSDETLQTGWSPVDGLAGTRVKSVIGDLDQTGLFVIDQASNVAECAGDCTVKNLSPVNTQGYLPLYLTADPSSKQLWMTSSSSGQVGNIFNRLSNPDYGSIFNTINPLDQKRDAIVKDIGTNYQKQTEVMSLNKQLSEFQTLFARLFGDATKAAEDTNTQIAKVQSDVESKTAQLKHVSDAELTIRKLVITLAVATLVYAIFSFLGWISHVIVLVVLGVGIYLSLNNDINFPTVWS